MAGEQGEVLLPKSMVEGWEVHLTRSGRGSDISGCKSLMLKSKQHVVHIWTAAAVLPAAVFES